MVEISCGSTTGSVYSFYGSESRPVIYDRRSLKVLTPDAIALKKHFGGLGIGGESDFRDCYSNQYLDYVFG